jgi:hypothetical protein
MTSQALCETVTTIYVALLDALGDDAARHRANSIVRRAIAQHWVNDPYAVGALDSLLVGAELEDEEDTEPRKGNVIAFPRRRSDARMRIIASHILRKRNIANAFGH